MHPGDQVKDRGFACPVGADQTVDLPWLYLEVEAMYGPQSSEIMGHILYFKQRGHPLSPSDSIVVRYPLIGLSYCLGKIPAPSGVENFKQKHL